MKEYAFDLKKPCDECPFMKATPLDGSIEWLEDILKSSMSGYLSHSCHKTDPNADGFKGGNHTQMCHGFLGVMLKSDFNFLSDHVMDALDKGKLDLKKIKTDGCYESLEAMLFEYIKKFNKDGLLPKSMQKYIDDYEKRIGV